MLTTEAFQHWCAHLQLSKILLANSDSSDFRPTCAFYQGHDSGTRPTLRL